MKKYILTLLTFVPFGTMAQQQKITILQTADIHAYMNPHDELFVENGQITFRKAGRFCYRKNVEIFI